MEEGTRGTGGDRVGGQAGSEASGVRRRRVPVRGDRAAEDGAGLAQKKVRTMNGETRMGWIDRDAGLAVARQCDLAGVARATFYGRQTPREESEEELVLCGLIDKEYTRRPFYGSRRMVVSLAHHGYAVNRKRVQRLMGLAGMAPGPSTSVMHPAHQVYPYLLRGIEVRRPNQVWSADISAPCRRRWRKNIPTAPAGCRPAAEMLPRSGRNLSGRGLQRSATCRWRGVIRSAA